MDDLSVEFVEQGGNLTKWVQRWIDCHDASVLAILLATEMLVA
jgi:hypothetical protein